MWLLNVDDQRLYEFYGEDIPPYAILSHTWGNQEVSFADINKLYRAEDKMWSQIRETGCANSNFTQSNLQHVGSNAHLPPPSPNFEAQWVEMNKPGGLDKIRKTCRRAKADGHQYVWIDTCCIDKSSSAELSEAINSMFSWYQNSKVCYAYLEDVEASSFEDSLPSSRWFTRGWTLQELIAPEFVVFVDKYFDEFGTKQSMASTISEITGIHKEVLQSKHPVQMSIAQRMSWAAKRQTTRIEDQAYCLLGIFDVHMPLLYGEGENAFRRLQEEIIKVSNDQSILAWQHESLGVNDLATCLAKSPRDFAQAGNIIPTLASEDRLRQPGAVYPDIYKSRATPRLYSMANSGFHIQLAVSSLIEEDELQPLSGDQSDQSYSIYAGGNEKLYVGVLNCQYEHDFSRTIGIILEPTSNAKKFVRHHGLARLPVGRLSSSTERDIFIVARLGEVVRRPLYTNTVNVFQHCVLNTNSVNLNGYYLSAPVASPEWEWSRDMETLTHKGDPLSTQNRAEISFTNTETCDKFTIRFCFGHPLPKKDIAELWDISIEGTVGKERKSSVGVDRRRDGVVASLCILVSKPVNGINQDIAYRISAGIMAYHMFGNKLCTLRIAMDEWKDPVTTLIYPRNNFSNSWIYWVPSYD
ncbi:HET-domain-containing protein [Lepidopterella palustris CBS 459.81]|uniref:HET-domain-containing protein n=1 Tax=Lepidopterella palustris CBS 459.81 TaxID=1314670 RepID=A0A8E2DYE4_9PEZI|nr:HET-domain-containing protein [Lepidopterella palustris CBS 459.81]